MDRSDFSLPGSMLSLLLVLSCSTPAEIAAPDTPVATTSEESTALRESDWVTVYDPQRSWNGYTLAFQHQRIPVLMDMNGRVVHRWPEARVKTRVRLLKDGSILGIALGRGLVEYDWEGNLLWDYEADYGFAHHDVIRLANGNTMTLIRPDGGGFDDIVEVDRSRNVVWKWQAGDHLKPFVSEQNLSKSDVTHMNSVQELPKNLWFDRGDARFRPGNLLASARELDLVFIIDRQTGEVVWTYSSELQKQHEPQMVEQGLPGAGRILIYNNRYRSFYRDRQSTILAVDPTTDRPVWQYRSAGFLSPTSGVQQHLPNGNVLITSTRGGRTFEITRAGRLVWEWAPPFDPMRSRRYPYDHTPQLAALALPEQVRVEPAAGYRYIDDDVFRFARRGLLRNVLIDGKKQKGVLKHGNDCRQIVLPLEAKALLEYGIDRRGAIEAGLAGFTAAFRLTLRRVGSDENRQLFEDRVSLDGETWRQASVDLAPFALQHIEFCIETEQKSSLEGSADREFAFWRRPVIRPGRADAAVGSEAKASTDELTAEELEARKKHLEALGYIN